MGEHPPPSPGASAADSPLARPATVRDAYRFFIPLLLMTNLMMISHLIITAFLARMRDPAPILAAYSIAFQTHSTIGSPVWACQIIALSQIRDRRSLWRMLAFGAVVAAALGVAWLALAATPAGDWFFQTVFDVRPEVAATARRCLLISLLILPAGLVRSIAYALMMVSRRTILVTYGTLVRFIGLAGLLAILTRWFEGAVVGMIALAGCIAIEAVYSLIAARPLYRTLPVASGAPLATYRELWVFSWPIMLMQMAESGVAFTVNFFLGRLPRPELALAAYAVIDSIVRVLLGPLRNLTHTIQALASRARDVTVLIAFCAQVTGMFALAMLVLDVPAVRGWVLGDVMGLPVRIAAYVAPALPGSVLVALGIALAATARGLLIASRRTGAIAASSAVRLVAVVVVGALALALDAENGALVGVLALTAAFGSEALVLGVRLLGLRRRREGLFAPEGA